MERSDEGPGGNCTGDVSPYWLRRPPPDEDDEEFDESEPSFWIRGSVCFHLVVEAWMSGRGDQAVFTISSILNGFLGRVKSVAPISPDGGLVLLITFNSFFPDQNGDLDETG